MKVYFRKTLNHNVIQQYKAIDVFNNVCKLSQQLYGSPV